MKRILILCLAINISIITLGQKECGTKFSAPPYWIFQKSRSTMDTSKVIINIYVHIVRKSDGTGNNNISQYIVNKLNNDYKQTNISFNLKGFDYIDNDNHYNYHNGTIDEEKFNLLIQEKVKEDGINIYVIRKTKFGDKYAGRANDVISKSLVVFQDYYHTSTLPHEVAHCLGLYHTHHGTVKEGDSDPNQCKELVNGSNGDTCGDYIKDTPADPSSWNKEESCANQYLGKIEGMIGGVLKDKNKEEYNPDPTNYMSYAKKGCRTKFTQGQIVRMHQNIRNSELLQKLVHYKISGSYILCDQETYTIDNLPNGATVEWSASNDNIQLVSGQGTGTAVFEKKYSYSIGKETINAKITINSQTMNLSKDVKTRTKITLEGYDFAMCNQTRIWRVKSSSCPFPSNTSFHWTLSSNNHTYYYDDSSTLVLSTSCKKNKTRKPNLPHEMYTLEVTVSAPNGLYETKEMLVDIFGDINIYYIRGKGKNKSNNSSIFPNPVNQNGVVNIQLQTKQKNQIDRVSKPYKIQLWNSLGLVKEVITDQEAYQLSLQGLPTGFYYVHIIKGKEITRKQLVIK